MSNIVYSTEINKDIRNAFSKYRACLDKEPQDKVKTNAAYCDFADACEKDHKAPLKVYQDLANEA